MTEGWKTIVIVAALALFGATTAWADPIPEADRPKLERLITETMAQYREAAKAGGAAAENLSHVERMLDSVQARSAELKRMGIDAQAVRAGIVYSDLGKFGNHLAPLAQELYPKEFANEKTRGAAFFRAFLLHEVPGRRLFLDQAAQAGLSRATIAAVEAANVGHNGPTPKGVFWEQAWKGNIKEGPAPSLEGKHGSLVREYAGKAYPFPSTAEGALHTALDRRDQGTRDGSIKIMAEVMGRGGTLKEAFVELFGENQRNTLRQFEALRARYPQIFNVDIVQEAERAVRNTVNYRNHVQFNREGTQARVHLNDGRVVQVSNHEGFREALTMIEEPRRTRLRNAATPITVQQLRESKVAPLRRRTVAQLLAEARRRNGGVYEGPRNKANLIAQLTGLTPARTAQLLRRTPPRAGPANTGLRLGGRRRGATRRLEALVPPGARPSRRRGR